MSPQSFEMPLWYLHSLGHDTQSFCKKIHDRVTNKLVIPSKAVGSSTPTVLPTIYFVRGRQRRVYIKWVPNQAVIMTSWTGPPYVHTYRGHFQKYEMALRTRMTEGPVVLKKGLPLISNRHKWPPKKKSVARKQRTTNQRFLPHSFCFLWMIATLAT